MSSQGKRNYRPKVHFTPLTMWANDPNGMVYVDGVYHLFYQHYPEAPIWGPMHWGHAISKDLLHWEHLPIALYPDELGLVFSGSCIYDINNDSGFGTKGKASMIAIYTSHNVLTHLEQQSMAYSTDLIHFEKYSENPIIFNPGIKDFRDPKLFWNSIFNCWSLVLAANDKVEFYSSKDLKKWEKTGEFLTGNNGLSGICECPDCFPVETEEDIKWVLVISMIIDNNSEGKKLHKTQYFIGTFDGKTFIDTENLEEPLWLNYGMDHYAGVTFQNLNKPILMAWANNWAYASDVPTNEYCGQMTIACEVKLKKTYLGYRVAYQPVGLEPLKKHKISIEKQVSLSSQSFGLEISGNGQGIITLSNTTGENLVIEVSEEEIIVDRTNADCKDFNEKYSWPQNNKVNVKRLNKGEYQLEILFDVSLLEVFAEEGVVPITMSVYPERPYDFLSLNGEIKATMFML